MNPMKVTAEQKELIRVLTSIIDSWASSNDLSSPTLHSDMSEELSLYDYPTDVKTLIEGGLTALLAAVKSI